MKKINLARSVYDLVEEYPEVKDILASVGFDEIKKPAMLSSLGRVMTLPKGAKMRKIPMEKIIFALMEEGFVLEGEMPKEISLEKEEMKKTPTNGSREEIKDFLRRLGEGEDLESVREDFVKKFQEVEASEIMRAEQELLEEGTPLEEVQKLCDVHSALFHGNTREEKIANAEKEVEASLEREETKGAYEKIKGIKGHPIFLFQEENQALESLLSEKEKHMEEDLEGFLEKIREISVHYAKKGDLLYPHLKVKYDISGPSNVMWTVDDEIRQSLKEFDEKQDKEKLLEVLGRMEEMIYKEENILFPIALENFTLDEWKSIYQDAKDYPMVFGVKGEKWEEAESFESPVDSIDGMISMPGGNMTVSQLRAMLNAIPLEISFVDDQNINRFFNEGPKLFKRPSMAIGREVFSCHPPKIEPMVRGIIEDFREGKRDSVPVWMEKNGSTLLVTYMAVRDHKGEYVGTMELVQEMDFAKEYFQG
ncbi:DUF438 domain-containing protein [Peptoniphilus sp. KCTC 25270]|uniref:DUF438 domain-containing protein n=1 Tax=Peptoniphilus sp. KCTC 25270 TaxID=2897414 RepID=UPI001E461FD5|nr:DUF438 domain-containing protein [Peptoniphilus sp. KCTC 25270]MCD1147505.1 DUF438 domain-containing protein [Peptoniphilus sp. KCTC 25270]